MPTVTTTSQLIIFDGILERITCGFDVIKTFHKQMLIYQSIHKTADNIDVTKIDMSLGL